MPPLIPLLVLLGVWELLCAGPDAALPPPSRVLADTWELITAPF